MPAPPISDLDLTSPSLQIEPYKIYSELRAIAPIHHLPDQNRYLVVGYGATREILTDPDGFSSALNASFDPVLLGADPPAHPQRRKKLEGHTGPFSKPRIAALDQMIRDFCTALLAPLEIGASFDLIADYGAPLPSLVILKYLGIKATYSPELREWTNTAVSNESIHNFAYSEQHWNTLKPFLEKFVHGMYEHPQEGIISELVQMEGWREMIDEANMVKLAKILLVGGNETTPNLIGSAVLELLNRPEMMAQVRNDLSLVPALIDETLRHQAPTQMVHRMTTSDQEVNGITIPAGSVVAVCIGAANRDPEVFSDPDQFILGRSAPKSIPFGAGAHYCIGAQLSILEGIIAVEELLKKFPQIEAATPLSELQYRPSSHVRGLISLPIQG